MVNTFKKAIIVRGVFQPCKLLGYKSMHGYQAFFSSSENAHRNHKIDIKIFGEVFRNKVLYSDHL